jgi:hypothetical protein
LLSPLFGRVVHQKPNALGAGREVHGAADGWHVVVGLRPIGEIAVAGDLECAEHAKVEMAAADEGEAVGVMHVRTAGTQRDVFLAGVDQPAIDLVRLRRRAHADDAVLRMDDDFALLRHVVATSTGMPMPRLT